MRASAGSRVSTSSRSKRVCGELLEQRLAAQPRFLRGKRAALELLARDVDAALGRERALVERAQLGVDGLEVAPRGREFGLDFESARQQLA